MTEERTGRLMALEVLASECTSCSLHKSRTNVVIDRGSRHAEIVFIGEAPGYHEDQQGEPFVGRSGKLLDNMIKAMGYERDEVYVCNICKCRPPDNRKPTGDEMRACEGFLKEQLNIVSPKVIVTLGGGADAEGILGSGPGVTKRRGNWEEYNGIKVMPTYHPAYCLRNPNKKHEVWEDLKQVMSYLGKEIPEENN